MILVGVFVLVQPSGDGLIDLDVEIPLPQHLDHIRGVRRQIRMHGNQYRRILESTRLGSSPAIVAVGGLFQPHEIQDQSGVVGAPLVSDPGFALLVGPVEVGVRSSAVTRVDDVHVVGQTIPGDLGGDVFLAGPSDDARDQAHLAPGLRGGEQLLELVVLQVFPAVQVGIFLLQIGGNDEGGLPVLAQTLAQGNNLVVAQGLVPCVHLVRQPYLQGHLTVSATEPLEEGEGVSQDYIGRVAVPLLDDVLGDPVLHLGARPGEIAEHDGRLLSVAVGCRSIFHACRGGVFRACRRSGLHACRGGVFRACCWRGFRTRRGGALGVTSAREDGDDQYHACGQSR